MCCQPMFTILIVTDVGVHVARVCDETHLTISHVDAGYRARVTVVSGECNNTAPVGYLLTLIMVELLFGM